MIKRYLLCFPLLALLALLCPVLSVSAGDEYKIGPGDVLEVIVWRDELLSRQVLVPPDGRISFPLIEDIQVEGMTVHELEQEMAQKLSGLLPDTPVSISLITTQSMAAYVVGKVIKSGQFPIRLDTSVMQILSMAGGLNPYADSKKIIILRKEGGEERKLCFNYDEVQKGENLAQNIILKRGDVVVVP